MRLSDVQGQPMVVRILQQALAQDRVSHAYLFHGADGVGKETTARALANHLLCETKEACGRCPSCEALASDRHVGFRSIRPDGGSIKIEQVRQIQGASALKSAKHRVWLIHEAWKMTDPAANSLLKCLEEPASMNTFILLAQNVHQVLPTIQSRCQGVRFRRLADEVVGQLLQTCLSEEGPTEEAEMALLVRMARGSVGRAVGLWQGPFLDRRKQVLSEMVRLPDLSIPEVLGLSLGWDEDRDVVEADLELMLQWYRDVLCLKSSGDAVLFNPDFADELQTVCQRYQVETLQDIAGRIQDMLAVVRHNIRPRFMLGTLLLHMRKGALR